LIPADIAANRLRAHPVVVLSGCDTAIGHVYRGEGSLSLARPFLAAGAAAVIATEWPLGDIDAPVMVAAIHNALRGDSPAAALAHAQRDAIRAGMTIDRWATFVAFGGF
jgi:CHAT domain-containing protein